METRNTETAPEHDFSFRSGERQTSGTLCGIRADHRNRYEFGINALAQTGFGLDVFCGNGYGTYMIAEQGNQVLGIDGSAEAITFANQTYATDATFFSHKVWPFAFPENAFDFVFCLESIEHIANYTDFLECIRKALKKGGTLVLSTPNEELFPFQPDLHRHHVKHFTHSEVRSLVAEFRLDLLDWGGQDVYDFVDGAQKQRADADQCVQRRKNGQFNTFICEAK
ncbi:MAG: class I SAM-dependent methyltransferase [Roseibium sp.]|uniref:class I SAM-dependent methyltransferase n=1 Tax=Roseibium sp. TaxID=1936156 RepID=UPI003D9C4557